MPSLYSALPAWIADIASQPGSVGIATTVLADLANTADTPLAQQYYQSLLDILAVFDGAPATTAALPSIVPFNAPGVLLHCLVDLTLTATAVA